MQLVPGRECGECTVCCVTPWIDDEQFHKAPGVRCKHLFGDKPGCSIHATVYETCRAFYCGWRYIAALGDDWRPDKSGVMINFELKDLPAHYPKRPGVRFVLAGGAEAAMKMEVLEQIGRLISMDIPVLLTMPGPPGYYPQSAFLNDALKEAVAQRDLQAVQTIVADALTAVAAREFQPARQGGAETGSGHE